MGTSSIIIVVGVIHTNIIMYSNFTMGTSSILLARIMCGSGSVLERGSIAPTIAAHGRMRCVALKQRLQHQRPDISQELH